MKNSSLLWQKSLGTGFYQVCKEKPHNAICVKQVHGAEVVSITEAQQTVLEADGLYWTWSDLNSEQLPTVLTADCLPIVILGVQGGAILHAGWRGVRAQIYAHPQIKKIQPVEFFIGPSIQHCSFEVTEEFLDYFSKKEFFQKKGDRYIFNLQAQAIDDLRTLYPGIRGEDSLIDTFTDSRFQSYRRDKKNRTNNYNVYSLNSL
jgi:copper oxidase (laccase) domain-containing protein